MLRTPFAAVLFLSGLAMAQMPALPVRVAPAQTGQIELTEPLVATLEAVTKSAVASEEAGIVAERSFDEGQAVEKGAVLARLNTDLMKAEHNAAVAAQKAAEASVVKADSELVNAQRNLDRIKSMFQGGGAAQKEYDDAVTTHQVALAAQLSGRATVEQRKAEVSRLSLMLEKAEIRAPFKGIISRRGVEVGQWIGRGEVVAELVQMDPLFVRVNVPEDVIAYVEKGEQAKVTIDALRGKTITGTVEQILPEADRGSRTFAVRLTVNNADLAMRPGLFARAVITTRRSGVLVPRDALVMRGTSMHVAVVREGKAAIVPVVRGAERDERVAVLGELREGDLVVIRGNEQLRGGETLIVQNPPGAASQPWQR